MNWTILTLPIHNYSHPAFFQQLRPHCSLSAMMWPKLFLIDQKFGEMGQGAHWLFQMPQGGVYLEEGGG